MSEAQEKQALTRVASWSLLLGLVAGLFAGQWQIAVEGGQYLTGLVSYPDGHPYASYYARLWNLGHQLSGWLLTLGWNERSISLLLQSLVMGLYMQLFAMTGWLLCRRIDLALLMAVVLCSVPMAPYFIKYDYAITFSSMHTYGMYGLAMSGLILVYFGVRGPVFS